MGFMAEGNTLGWEEAAKHAEFIRQHGIQQLLSIYNKYKDRKNDRLQWGDEVCLSLFLLSVGCNKMCRLNTSLQL